MKIIIKKILNLLPDKLFIKLKYFFTFNEKINLKKPQTFNEKLNWLKLYDRKEIYTQMVDKYEAKKHVANIIGEEYIIPTIGIYNKFDDINFEKLPNQFVIKTTHDSGGVVICKNKKDFDVNQAKKIINKSLKNNYYYSNREWQYKNIKPRIIIEKYIGENINDYKIQCFYGKVDDIMVCSDRYSKDGVKYYYFDKEWRYMPYCVYPGVNEYNINIAKPQNLDKMINIAEKLSKNLIEVRIDLYNVNGKIYFGEITFFSNAGFDTTITREADIDLGKKLKLKIGDKNEN